MFTKNERVGSQLKKSRYLHIDSLLLCSSLMNFSRLSLDAEGTSSNQNCLVFVYIFRALAPILLTLPNTTLLDAFELPVERLSFLR
nr:MAG TPA: hypothetical protein [Caudoviricetes sp.]